MKNLSYAILALSAFFYTCKAQGTSVLSKEEQLYRPNYHFTPEKGWMNDPNGMFYLDGTYHLLFQHNPANSKWGTLHWGHATSEDLVKWENQPIAIYPDQMGYIFSGSAVVDKNNTSGLGDGKNVPIVAIFTYHDMDKEKANRIDVESQGMAYSLDKGKTWTKYSNNPVLKNPGIRDFRDPKIFWEKDSKQWIMVVAAQDRQHFYGSKNLKDWTFLSEFGKDFGGHGGVWECPDLFPIKVEGTNEEKWVLIVNINPGGPNGGSAAQYFVGDFDGKTFKMDDVFTKQLEKEKVAWLDWGRDNYASVSFDNVPDNKRVIIGWMSNWDYSPDVPTEKWRGSSTIPREVTLKRSKDGYILKNIPVSQLKNYEGKTVKKEINLGSDKKLIGKGEIDLSKAVIDVDFKKMTKGVYTFTLKNSLGEQLIFGIDNNKRELFVDRTKSGKIDFKDNFADRISKAPLSKSYQNATLKIVLDKTSIEIFFNNGEKVMTEIFFPNESFSELSLSTDTTASTVNFNAHQLNIK